MRHSVLAPKLAVRQPGMCYRKRVCRSLTGTNCPHVHLGTTVTRMVDTDLWVKAMENISDLHLAILNITIVFMDAYRALHGYPCIICVEPLWSPDRSGYRTQKITMPVTRSIAHCDPFEVP